MKTHTGQSAKAQAEISQTGEALSRLQGSSQTDTLHRLVETSQTGRQRTSTEKAEWWGKEAEWWGKAELPAKNQTDKCAMPQERVKCTAAHNGTKQ